MSRPIHRLTHKEALSFQKPGTYADGGGLYLRIRGEARSWISIYHLEGRRREIGLGGFPEVSLAEARDANEQVRRIVRDGRDPIAERRSRKPTNPNHSAQPQEVQS